MSIFFILWLTIISCTSLHAIRNPFEPIAIEVVHKDHATKDTPFKNIRTAKKNNWRLIQKNTERITMVNKQGKPRLITLEKTPQLKK